MLTAVLGDSHGNLPAVEAVLAAIDARGIHTILHTGDAVVGYPWPNEVVTLLRDRAVVCVQGELDRLTVRVARKTESLQQRLSEEIFRAIAWTYDRMESAHVEWLKALPLRRTLKIEGIQMVLFHGMPTTQSEALDDHDDLMRFQRVRELVNVPLVICGKTHHAYARWIDDTLFVNPGSAGVPVGNEGVAKYAVIDTETDPWGVELLSAAYDAEGVKSALRDQALPDPRAYLG